MLQNASLVAIVAVDTAENEPSRNGILRRDGRTPLPGAGFGVGKTAGVGSGVGSGAAARGLDSANFSELRKL